MSQNKYYSRYYTYITPVITNKLVKSSTPYIFSVLAVTLFMIFIIRPTLSTIAQLQKNIETHKQILDQLKKKGQDLTLAKQNFDSLDPQTKERIKLALPSQAQVTSLVKSLEDSVKKEASFSALQVQSVTVYDNAAEATTSPNLGEIEFALNAQGSYQQLMATLDYLKHSSRIVTLTNIVLNKPAEGNMSLSVTGKAYLLKN
ncbi:MAG: hypothetical protein UU73_C0002G0175 [Candidatus Daviesbacteria bacterium GW2011_GWA1_41_61]|uniref:Pilus assembly protein, PilO n=1 Tax=Candidatus Daviesbacteria bacterium GW2011_GWA2_40_9 TaxID=1618424 RepID=A0A0G0U2X6_9BACT|nr:MAG: hypothetical protein UU26_C0009G0026 [Candidatus Daviesbacteria bacterium GW2011_GWC1_40_9]KKR83453.1 MAG: hypothetical protein UU29_C0005G0034 [Candidatus Daviesbacteria bacterium GW2011_GWA2_40_9]KKR93835.1 MAG: hypothetical protein UU44_C0001G0175 [Candidatus Daviesbacteria bacterium GW2011_GWB1_41_15]KKS15301.1 MAG: hypothetical protein UU73_C0002G0175 [Candidatus Daviesbacteria bacterium GW2011_GWA1_41_61]